MFTKLAKNHYLIGLSAILILSAAGFAYYEIGYIPAQATNAAKLASQNSRTAVAQQGDLTIYARGTGTLIARDEINLGFGTSGPISILNVRIGDKVHKGDVLAVQGNREQLQAAVASDQVAVLNAKQALETLGENAGVVSAQAQFDLATAKSALLKADYTWSRFQVKKSPARWKQYLAASPSFFRAAETEFKRARGDLEIARANYSQYTYLPAGDSQRTRTQTELLAAQQKYDSALQQLITAYPAEIQPSQIDNALIIAAARVIQTELVLEKVNKGSDPVKAAIADQELAKAQATLALSQRKLEQSTILAPMDGTILSVTAKVGDDISGPFISMANRSQQYLTISLDGTNIDKIALDYKVEVIFDALPNQIFTGRVIQIDPILYTPTGQRVVVQTPGQITFVKGFISLDESAMTPIDNLPLGMSATVDVIGGQVKGVVLVPLAALHKQTPGKYTVFVMEKGKQVLRPVEVGLMDSAYAEIKSGLKVGEIVVTSPMGTK